MAFDWILNIIKLAIESRFTGSIKINFFMGGVTNIEKNESMKPPKKADEQSTRIEALIVQYK